MPWSYIHISCRGSGITGWDACTPRQVLQELLHPSFVHGVRLIVEQGSVQANHGPDWQGVPALDIPDVIPLQQLHTAFFDLAQLLAVLCRGFIAAPACIV